MSEQQPLLSSKSNISQNYDASKKERKIGCCTRRQRKRDLEKYNTELEELQAFYEMDKLLVNGSTVVDTMEERGPDRWLARASLILNSVLLVITLGASIFSGSLSIISTFVEAFMDIMSSLIISLCLRYIQRTNAFKYPRGRDKLELLGVIFCSTVMGISNTLLFLSAVTQIMGGDIHPEVNIYIVALMLGGSAVKVVLLVLCYRRGTPPAIVLAMDMRNDIITSVMATICAYIGATYWPYADPAGAIIVCGCIAVSWFRHALSNVPQLVGIRANKMLLSRILKVAIEHDKEIRGIDHIAVYHSGVNALVELHIVMDENLPLKITHDISHPLERKLLRLPFVERAFVHCDYFYDGDIA